MNNPTILLTGATRFLGSHLLEALLKQGYSVVVLNRQFPVSIDNIEFR